MTGPINSDVYTELARKAAAHDAAEERRRANCALCADGIAFVDDRPPVLPAMHPGKQEGDPARLCTATEAVYIARLEAQLKTASSNCKYYADQAIAREAERDQARAGLAESESKRKREIISLSEVLSGYQRRVGELESAAALDRENTRQQEAICRKCLEDNNQARAAAKVATDALANARQAFIDYEMVSDGDPTFEHRNLMEGIGTALSTEAVAAEFARQQAQADELAHLRERIEELTNERDGALYQLELRVDEPEKIRRLTQERNRARDRVTELEGFRA